MSYIVINEQRCKGCALCTIACPANLISMNMELNNLGNTVAVFSGTERCEGCALCAEMCPDIAISVYRQA